MKFMKKGRRRWIALIMALVMIFTAVSWDMLRKESKADESQSNNRDSETEYLNDLAMLDYSTEEVVELKDERTKNSTSYSLGNGLKKVVYYSDDVRYETKDGKLVDYDSSLKEVKTKRGIFGGNKYKYENSNGDNKNYLPTDIEKTPVKLGNKNYSVELSPIFDKSKENEFNNVKDMASAKAIVEQYDDIYDKSKKAVVGAEYVSTDKKMAIEYISSDKGIKENIILNIKPQSNVWKFNIDLGKLTPELDKNTGIIYLYDGKNKVGQIDKPFMNDATGEAYSEDITYEIKNKRGSVYELTMTVDKEYLESADRKYPITIDPTLSWSGQGQIDDVQISSAAHDTNLYGRTSIRTGNLGNNTYRTYISFENLDSQIEGKSVASARLTLSEAPDSVKGQVVEAYRVNEEWDKSQITWDDSAEYDNKMLSSIVALGQDKKESTFDITSFVRGVAKGSYENNGIMLKAKDDTNSPKYNIFYASKHELPAYKPRLEIVYYDRPTTATVSLEKRFVKPGVVRHSR